MRIHGLLALLLLPLSFSIASAGPNAWGGIQVHDAGLAYTTDLPSYCGLGNMPGQCQDLDARLDGSDPEHIQVWKVFATFPEGSSPRLKGMTFGVGYTDGLVLAAWGPCIGDPNQGAVELPGGGWPGPDTGTSIVFQYTQTSLLIECYWFAGYNYGAPQPQRFWLGEHPDPVLGGMFGDDSVPALLDPIFGYGQLGFERDGLVPCPPSVGACCFPDGHCEWIPDGDCPTGDWREGVLCDPNPCPQPLGACCDPSGACAYVAQPDCPTGDWREGVPCDPNPCPILTGACCVETACHVTLQEDCGGMWLGAGTDCDPNPCAVTGACCRGQVCTVVPEHECAGRWLGPDTSCEPNPCDCAHRAPSGSRGRTSFFADGQRRTGPNQGGTIIVHDAGVTYTSDDPAPCASGAHPSDCAGADTRLDESSEGNARLWRVYAAFYPGSQPRLKGMTWGVHYAPEILVTAWGACIGDPSQGAFEMPDDCWPDNDTGVVLVFQHTQTDLLIPCYWFAGYAATGAAGTFELTAHPNPVLGGMFGDDSIPSILDDIAGFGSMGFNTGGLVVCPMPWGACCDVLGRCSTVTEDQCPTGEWTEGLPCDPNPCPPPVLGACCHEDGHCVFTAERACGTGDWRADVPCNPNPCPQPLGACCYATGACEYVTQWACPTGDWRMEVPCDPNPCPELDGACCFPDGHCEYITSNSCDNLGGLWLGPAEDCMPNPCPQPRGACCFPGGVCTLETEADCEHHGGIWQGAFSDCDPNPCPQPYGACCYPDETCQFVQESDCPTGSWRVDVPCDPNPCVVHQGACCYPNGTCQYVLEPECGTGVWYPDTSCDPNPCPQPLGACCYPDLHCEFVPSQDCPTGDWRANVPCEPNPCVATGACCYGERCEVSTEGGCHGVWQGAGTDCDPNPCVCYGPRQTGRDVARGGGEAPDSRAAGSVGPGKGVMVPSQDSDPCGGGILVLNYDGSAENGFCWQYGGIVPPYYGAFAECYDAGTGTGVCGIQLHLTGIGYPCGPFDAYVWSDCYGAPFQVISMTSGLNPCPVATWPNVSEHDLGISDTYVDGLFWIGFWADHQPCAYFVGADTDGFGGCPMTNIAPGIGYPTGWNSVSTVWGPTQSIGIGAWLGVGGPNNTETTTWGRIKHLYK